MWKYVRRSLAIAALMSGTLSFAQSTNAGDIRGTVTDTTGAVVPGATVTVLNTETGVSRTYTTNQDGVYDTNSIVVGSYKLTFTHQGFEQLVRGPISIQVGFATVNAQLQVGSTEQVVTVTTNIPLLNTDTGAQSQTLEAKTIDQLPNIGGAGGNSNGPDWQNFIILLPGAAGAPGSNAGASNPGAELSANGNLPYTNVLEDGATSTLPASSNANPAPLEDVEEVQVNLSSFSAQYGIGGVIMNQITKGGSDHFHGSAYEYFENNALNAANYGFGTKETIPFLRFDDFGGTFSGPVPLGRFRKKAFFFFGYDQIVNHTVSPGFDTVPNASFEAGTFNGGYAIYDPFTQTIGTDSHGNPFPIRKTFQQEYGSNAIPANLIDSVSANFQKFYPTSQSAPSYGHFVSVSPQPNGVDQNDFYTQPPQPRPWKRYFGRLDYDISPKNRLTLTDNQGDELENGDGSGITLCPIACQFGDVDNNNAQITDVWTLGPRTVNEARFGYTDQLNFFSDQGLNKGYPAQLGWQYAKGNVIPNVSISGFTGIGPATNAQYKEFTFDPSDVVTLIRGKQILHFGGEFAFYRDDATNWGNINAGTLNFSGQYTQAWDHQSCTGSNVYPDEVCPDAGTGEAYADFLLGTAQSWNASYTPEFGARLKKPQMFVQDDIKLKPNLTINAGLRYEISHGFNEVTGNEATFDPTIINPATNTLGAYWYGATHTNGRKSLQANVWSTVMPRLGFSWLPNSKTTVRGGFGLYSYNFSLDNYGSGMGAAFGSSGSLSDQTNGINPVTLFDGPGTIYGTNTPLPYTSASTSPTRFNGQGVGYNAYHTPVPKIWQWNFGVERELNTNTVATVSYVASHGFNLAFPTDINAVPENELSSNDSSLRPFANYTNISGNIYNAISNYNSLQATITKRYSSGFSFSFNYTWSHFLDDQDSSGWGSHSGEQVYQHASTLTLNQASLNYGASNFDVRNAFKGYALYQLPFGIGHAYMNHSHLLDTALGGWQVSGTVVETSGNPYTIVIQNGQTYNQASGSYQFPNRVSGVSLTPPGGRNKVTGAWFNPAAFSNPGPGNFGSVGRNSFYGPGLNYFTFSAGKNWAVYRKTNFQLRADANNVFNHPSFGPPGGGGGPYQLICPVGACTGTSPNGQINSLTEDGRVLQITGRFTF